MLLTCDIGNTFIKTGIFITTAHLKDLKYFKNISSLNDYIRSVKPDEIAIASVVPEITKEILAFLKKIEISHLIISKDLKFNLKINYKTPETLGIDRLCSSEGAFFLFKNSDDFAEYNVNTFIITIDFGTATTINFINHPGIFEGGIIAPGINMMFNSLQKSTAQLPKVFFNNYKSLIGKDTRSSIASGVLNSAVGLVEKSLNYLHTKLKAEKFKIYVTGGNAEEILNHLNFKFEYVRGLVLIGVKEIYLRNKKRL